MVIAVQCHSFFKSHVLYFLHFIENITLAKGLQASPDFQEVHGTHTKKANSPWQSEGTAALQLSSSPALVSLPGFPRAEILRFVCFLRKLVREETGATDKSSWHDVLCSP